eukprot:CAMPEP_0117483048 /NCGR_PEP_ID=MMETSP0784-20121206/13736_1 /TAXON_ID=39447 /ORGANISM="" /LENGTH=551 /DNA_ID=CAMNT_0005277567 /DNA_START=9 /DNA_END=1660 /DNA_ORIENTATION=-
MSRPPDSAVTWATQSVKHFLEKRKPDENDHADWAQDSKPYTGLPADNAVDAALPHSFKHNLDFNYFVVAEFHRGEKKMGLVLDWSMAYPVVAGVVRGLSADRNCVRPGLVMVALNGTALAVGRAREKVEEQLAERPLKLVFVRPDPARFGEVRLQLWQMMGPSNATGLARPSAAQRAKHMVRSASAATTSKFSGGADTIGRFSGGSDTWSKPSRPTTSMMPMTTGQSFSVTSSAMSTGQSFFEAHPERIPLSRFANFDGPENSLQRWPRGPGDTKSMNGSRAFTEFSRRGSQDMALTSSSYWSQTSLGGASSLGHQGPGQTPTPDVCYEDIWAAKDGAPKIGPGPVAGWALDHDEGNVCLMADLCPAQKLHDAYSYGFRGRKLDRPTEMHIRMYKAAPVRQRLVRDLEEDGLWCDLCGEDITHRFWFCRACKFRGKRFEVCVQCHAVEVLQGEGKHVGQGIHPHYLRHAHRDLAMFKDLRFAYPYSSHIRRVFCDHCGCLMNFREERAVLYVCLRCPEDHGLRLEMCEDCALAIRDGGHGIQDIRDMTAEV